MITRRGLRPFGLLALLLAAAPRSAAPVGRAFGAEFHVSPSGDDTDPGTASRPFATLERARTAVRELKRRAGLPPGGIAVTLHRGTYRRKEPFILTATDSGTHDRPVVWRARRGEAPRIAGGARIIGWNPMTSSDPAWSRIHATATLYRATVPRTAARSSGLPGNGPFAELFYDDRPLRLGGWPKGEASVAVSGNGPTLTLSVVAPPRLWSVAKLSPVNRPWAHVRSNAFADQMLRIIGVAGDTVTVERAPIPLDRQAVWQVTNSLEEVDEPGEYWIDREAAVVYLRPPNDRNPNGAVADIEISVLDRPLVELEDGSSYVRFEGITFEVGQSHLVVVRGHHHAFVDCTFRNGADSGLVLFGESHDVERVAVYGLGAIGIVTVGDSRNIRISDSDVHDVARHLHNGNAGLAVGGVGHVIRHNVIHDLPWSAIALGGRAALVELNEFRATQRDGCDSGTIYAGGTDTATYIRHNYFHDVARPSSRCIYPRAAVYIDTDPGSPDASGFQVEGNVFYRYGDGVRTSAPGKGIAIINKGSRNGFRGNIFVEVDVPYVAGYLGRTGVVEQNQTWKTGERLPPGNIVRDPEISGLIRARLSNRCQGSIAVAGVGEPIPFCRIGIRTRN